MGALYKRLEQLEAETERRAPAEAPVVMIVVLQAPGEPPILNPRPPELVGDVLHVDNFEQIPDLPPHPWKLIVGMDRDAV